MSPKDIKGEIGKDCFLTVEALEMDGHLEIERKYLIEKPCILELSRLFTLDIKQITQTYLLVAEGIYEEHRIRKVVSTLGVEFFETTKTAGCDLVRQELESKISKLTYDLLIKEADKRLKTLEKRRYTFDFESQKIEIDIYDFGILEGKAVVEVEIPTIDTPVFLPEQLKVISEVTGDSAFQNRTLAII